jgi:hypothetical protein
MTQGRIKVTGLRRQRLDENRLAMALWIAAKAQVDAKRKREAAEKERGGEKGGPDER